MPTMVAPEQVGIAFTTDNESLPKARHDVSLAMPTMHHNAPVSNGPLTPALSDVVRPDSAMVDPTSMPPSFEVLPPRAAPIAMTPAPSVEPSSPGRQGHRVFGLKADLSGPSADSAFLPHALHAKTSTGSQATAVQPTEGNGTSGDSLERTTSSSKESTSSRQRKASSIRSNSHSQLPALPSMTTHGQTTPASAPNAPSDGSSQFSIEVIATSFDKRGYPIFSGRAARIRGIIRMKAIRDCHVEIKLGAYICQGSPAVVWDGVALMPDEAGKDHKLFSITERIELDQSMMRTRAGSSASEAASEDFIFETPFDLNLPLGISTRFVNGEPTVTSVALPPSFEMSSESVAREREANRSSNLLKSGAASIRSRSSKLTSLTSTSANVGATIRDAVDRTVGEVYRIGCFYNMEFSLVRAASAGTQKRKLFGKAKPAQPVVLDKITVPFIFLGEQSTELPPPLSIPATTIANAVARPGSFLGDGWQCERTTVKWPGKLSTRQTKRIVDLEVHLPFPATVHAPSLFPVLIIIRPHDSALLASVPVDFVPTSPSQEEAGWAATGHGHNRQASSSSAALHRLSGKNGQLRSPVSGQDEWQSDNDANDTESLVNRFMRSSLSLSRKASANNMKAARQANGRLIGNPAADVGASPGRSQASSIAPSQTTTGSAIDGPAMSFRDSVSGSWARSRRHGAPTSRSSSDGRSRISGSTVTGSGGEYFGNLSGLVRVSLVQTTFAISTGPSELPKNLRKLISIAEVEELDAEALRAMVRGPTVQDVQDGTALPDDEHQTLLRQALQEQLDNKGVRVLRALFRVGSDPTPSFRSQGIELRYAIKVDLVPFTVKERLPRTRTSSATGSNGAASIQTAAGRSSGSLGATLPTSPAMPPSASMLKAPSTADDGSRLSTAIVSSNEAETIEQLAEPAAASSARSTTDWQDDETTAPSSDYQGTVRSIGQSVRTSRHLPRSGDSVVSTVYARDAESYKKIEKGIGVLFVNVRMVRAAV